MNFFKINFINLFCLKMISTVFKEKNDRDSIFHYIPNFLNEEEVMCLINWLDLMKDFLPCTHFEKEVSSRYQKWYQKDNKYFCPKWKNRYDRWKSHKYDDILENLQIKIQNKINELNLKDQFNSCLINKYLDGSNFIKKHRDTILSFGEYPTIVGLSLGSHRILKFSRIIYNKNNYNSIKIDKNSKKHFEFLLESGSIFIMAGSSQKYFVHEIPTSDKSGLRYSLTFREFIS